MASMRKLRRRLTRWQRYAQRYRPGRWPRNYNVIRCDVRDPRGFLRADIAVRREQERRFWDETPEVWMGGPEGEAALIADVLADVPLYCTTCGGPCRDDDEHWTAS